MIPSPVDLRSDTVTRPSDAMRQAMAQAPVGDDMFGEDPTVNALQARAAALFGKEAGLFVPSGTMGNQIALHVYCRPGDMAIAGDGAHSLLYEGGGAEALSGVQLRTTPSALFSPEEAEALYHDDGDVHVAETTLVMVENTHNRAGGVPWTLAQLAELRAWAQDRELPIHMDGARVLNAAVATGQDPRSIGDQVDSLSFCLSKGLGCPVGSVLVGSSAFIHRARRARKRMGGAMRQAGILAAAGLYALENNVERLQEDHHLTRMLAEGWGAMKGLRVGGAPPTNLLYVEVDGPGSPARRLAQRLGEAGVLVLPVGPRKLRAVCHLDVNEAGIHRAIAAMAEALG